MCCSCKSTHFFPRTRPAAPVAASCPPLEYFRPHRPTHANKRKSEPSEQQTHPREPLVHGRPKTPFSPRYGANRSQFSTRNKPSMRKSKGWNARSMGWKQKSKGWSGPNAPPRRISNAKTRTTVGARINALPYSAQGFPCGRTSPTTQATPRGRRPHRGRTFYNRG